MQDKAIRLGAELLKVESLKCVVSGNLVAHKTLSHLADLVKEFEGYPGLIDKVTTFIWDFKSNETA